MTGIFSSGEEIDLRLDLLLQCYLANKTPKFTYMKLGANINLYYL